MLVRKKEVFTAVQWDASAKTWEELLSLGMPWRAFQKTGSDKFIIPIATFSLVVNPGDWVLKNEEGNFDAVTNEYFEKTYELHA